jgi:thiamine biosynthesis lipoprotein
MSESLERFGCFGGSCDVYVGGDGPEGPAAQAAATARRVLLAWHRRFSRFIPESELSQLNADPRAEVAVSPTMALLASAVGAAGLLSGGLVDGTLLDEIEAAGYDRDIREPLGLERALMLAPPRAPASADPRARWGEVTVDLARRLVRRPPGVRIDSGGIAKGLFADLLAGRLAAYDSFAVNCGGDLAIGGAARKVRKVEVESPFDGRVLHTFEVADGGVATSGIGRRSWIGRDGRAAHHLLDPCSGRPVFSGVVQVTALAASAFVAEVRAKAVLLAGPRAAAATLSDGGLVVLDDGTHHLLEPARRISMRELSAHLKGGLSVAVGRT